MLRFISIYNEVILARPVLEGSEMLSSFPGFGPCFTLLENFFLLEIQSVFCFFFFLLP